MNKLPIAGEGTPTTGQACQDCSGCNTKSGLSRVIPYLMFGIACVASIILWAVLPQAVSKKNAAEQASRLTPAAVPANVAPPVAPPLAAPLGAAPMRHGTQLVLATPTDMIPICRGQPMPHAWRGACVNCHVTTDCPMGSNMNAQAVRMAVPTITRAALLPHAFAGVCMNCHSVLGGPPTPVNLDNMNTMELTLGERRLLLAGQQVRVPSLVGEVKSPVIGGEAMLPHTFVGVCSNCHGIVHWNTGPSPEFMSWGMAQAGITLLDGTLAPNQIAHARLAPRNEGRWLLMIIFGLLGLGFFLVSLVYLVQKRLVLSNPEKYRRRFDMKKWLRIHEWTSIGFCLTAIVHWFLAREGNIMLHVSLVLAIMLTISGLGLRQRRLKKHKKSLRWLHGQQGVFMVMVILTIAGHVLAGVTTLR